MTVRRVDRIPENSRIFFLKELEKVFRDVAGHIEGIQLRQFFCLRERIVMRESLNVHFVSFLGFQNVLQGFLDSMRRETSEHS